MFSPNFYLIAAIVISFHSFLNFMLCDKLSDSLKFHKISMYIACLTNGIVGPLFLFTNYNNPMTQYFICTIILLVEFLVLFKSRLYITIGVCAGSLLHLFVLRAIIIAVFSLVNKIPMNEIIHNEQFFPMVNLLAFLSQVITLSLFIKLMPLKVVKEIMLNKSFYTGLLSLTLLLNIYIIFNSYMFTVDVFSVNIAVQEIVIALFILAFLYIMLFMLIKVIKLGVYKEKTQQLEHKIDKDKLLTSAIFNIAEVILEVNCTQDKMLRILINSVERPTEHLDGLSEFFIEQTKIYTHPEDVGILDKINSKKLLSDFENGYNEKLYEYRSKKIHSSDNRTGVKSIDDNYLWFRMRINLSRDEESSDVIALFTIDEIDTEKQEEISLRKKAETDPLTGSYNKETIAIKINEYVNKGGQGALYMFDLDNFKGINDNMGHAAGDEVLREVYAKTTSVFRPSDLVSRVGGDEFLVYLAGTARYSTLQFKAEQICKEMSKVYHADNGVDIEISCSVGISISPKDGTDFDSLYKAADIAMYHSKSIGKNTFTFYDDSSTGYKPQEKEDYMRIRSINLSDEKDKIE